MPKRTITRRQLVRLQTLWQLLAKQEGIPHGQREARLAWAGAALGVYVASFKELRADQAANLIEKIQEHLPPELVQSRPRKSRHRKSKKPGAVAIERARTAPSAASLALITTLLGELAAATGERRDLAWLEEWLRTGRSAPARALRTQRDADRIIPALRNMVRRCSGGFTPPVPAPDGAGPDGDVKSPLQNQREVRA